MTLAGKKKKKKGEPKCTKSKGNDSTTLSTNCSELPNSNIISRFVTLLAIKGEESVGEQSRWDVWLYNTLPYPLSTTAE